MAFITMLPNPPSDVAPHDDRDLSALTDDVIDIAREVNDRNAHALTAISVILAALEREVRDGRTPDELDRRLGDALAEAERSARRCVWLDQRFRDASD